MDTKQENQSACGCSDGCCPPEKKRPGWKLWISILLLVAAVAIVAVKLAGERTSAAAGPPAAASCDTTGGVACDTTRGSSCCPKTTD